MPDFIFFPQALSLASLCKRVPRRPYLLPPLCKGRCPAGPISCLPCARGGAPKGRRGCLAKGAEGYPQNSYAPLFIADRTGVNLDEGTRKT